jgi:Tol biopolymer transport system component
LNTLNIAGGAAERIFDSGDWDRGGQVSDLSAIWSPAGDRVALALQGSYGGHFSVWSLRPDGSEPVRIYDGAAAAYGDPVHFSADGAYLAVSLWDPYWQRQTAVYDAATGAKGIRLAGVGGWPAWSPTGHELLMSTYEGLSLITNPGDALSQPKLLDDSVCYRGLWSPAS